jgi:hypothetical protein
MNKRTTLEPEALDWLGARLLADPPRKRQHRKGFLVVGSLFRENGDGTLYSEELDLLLRPSMDASERFGQELLALGMVVQELTKRYQDEFQDISNKNRIPLDEIYNLAARFWFESNYRVVPAGTGQTVTRRHLLVCFNVFLRSVGLAPIRYLDRPWRFLLRQVIGMTREESRSGRDLVLKDLRSSRTMLAAVDTLRSRILETMQEDDLLEEQEQVKPNDDNGATDGNLRSSDGVGGDKR